MTMNKPEREIIQFVEAGMTGEAVEIAPGIYVSKKLPLPKTPLLGIVQIIPDPQTKQPLTVITAYERTVRITRENYDSWGFGGSYDVFYKLIRAGFIRVRRISPEALEVLPKSLIYHLRRCEEPDFWNAKRIERYRTANWGELRVKPQKGFYRKNKKKKTRRIRENQLTMDFANPNSAQFQLWEGGKS